MPSVNTTLQQYSPLITYLPDGAWRTGSAAIDTFWQYYDDGFSQTTVTGASAIFRFYGSAVWLFGAHRSDHGEYTVVLDGIPSIFNGTGMDRFQTVLFGSTGLSNDVEHVIQLINSGTNPNSPVLDLDYITWQSDYGDENNQLFQQYVDVSSKAWNYGHSWKLDKVDGARNGVLLTCNTPQASAKLSFTGNRVDVYGSVGTSCGSFSALLDGVRDPSILSCNNIENRLGVLLYSANVSDSGNHTLQLVNVGSQGRSQMALDYAVVTTTDPNAASINPLNGVQPNTPPAFPVGILIAIIVSGVSVLAIGIGVCIWLRLGRLRKIRPGARREFVLEANVDDEAMFRPQYTPITRPATAASTRTTTTQRAPASTIPVLPPPPPPIARPWSSPAPSSQGLGRSRTGVSSRTAVSNRTMQTFTSEQTASSASRRPRTAPRLTVPQNYPPQNDVFPPTQHSRPRIDRPPSFQDPIPRSRPITQPPIAAPRRRERSEKDPYRPMNSPPPDYYSATSEKPR